jgi:hypothetical protein
MLWGSPGTQPAPASRAEPATSASWRGENRGRLRCWRNLDLCGTWMSPAPCRPTVLGANSGPSIGSPCRGRILARILARTTPDKHIRFLGVGYRRFSASRRFGFMKLFSHLFPQLPRHSWRQTQVHYVRGPDTSPRRFDSPFPEAVEGTGRSARGDPKPSSSSSSGVGGVGISETTRARCR